VARRLPPILTAENSQLMLSGAEVVSLDLGLTKARVEILREAVVLPTGDKVSFEDLGRMAERKDTAFFPDNGRIFQIAVSNGHYYKLVPTSGAPTIEIDGIRMHRTKGTTPDKDASDKIEKMGISGGRVLDTCAGLGYTAGAAFDRGAEAVVSIEVSPQVLRIAQMNPWSLHLFDGDVSMILGDVFLVLDALPEGLFDYVIHDPPRLSLAGRLYGDPFYGKLFSAVARGGRLFHYVGEPGSRHRGIDLRRSVSRRLRAVGFKNVEYHDDVMGLTCEK
jgi:predicted methyltransferase